MFLRFVFVLFFKSQVHSPLTLVCSCWRRNCGQQQQQEPVGQRSVFHHQSDWSKNPLQQVRQGECARAAQTLVMLSSSTWSPTKAKPNPPWSSAAGCRSQSCDQRQESRRPLLRLRHHVVHRGGVQVHQSPSQDRAARQDDLCGAGEEMNWYDETWTSQLWRSHELTRILTQPPKTLRNAKWLLVIVTTNNMLSCFKKWLQKSIQIFLKSQ